MRERKLPEAMAVVCLSNAALLFCGNLFNEKLRLSWDAFYSVAAVAAEGLSLVQFLLFIWLLREMPPERFAGRFLLIPLLTISEGYILLWPELTVRMGAGLLALAIGAVWIPFSSRAEDAPSLSLR